jgi:hypothetical protein
MSSVSRISVGGLFPPQAGNSALVTYKRGVLARFEKAANLVQPDHLSRDAGAGFLPSGTWTVVNDAIRGPVLSSTAGTTAIMTLQGTPDGRFQPGQGDYTLLFRFRFNGYRAGGTIPNIISSQLNMTVQWQNAGSGIQIAGGNSNQVGATLANGAPFNGGLYALAVRYQRSGTDFITKVKLYRLDVPGEWQITDTRANQSTINLNNGFAWIIGHNDVSIEAHELILCPGYRSDDQIAAWAAGDYMLDGELRVTSVAQITGGAIPITAQIFGGRGDRNYRVDLQRALRPEGPWTTVSSSTRAGAGTVTFTDTPGTTEMVYYQAGIAELNGATPTGNTATTLQFEASVNVLPGSIVVSADNPALPAEALVPGAQSTGAVCIMDSLGGEWEDDFRRAAAAMTGLALAKFGTVVCGGSAWFNYHDEAILFAGRDLNAEMVAAMTAIPGCKDVVVELGTNGLGYGNLSETKTAIDSLLAQCEARGWRLFPLTRAPIGAAATEHLIVAQGIREYIESLAVIHPTTLIPIGTALAKFHGNNADNLGDNVHPVAGDGRGGVYIAKMYADATVATVSVFAPTSVVIERGASVQVPITIQPLNGFAGNVSVSASGLPAGVTVSYSPVSPVTVLLGQARLVTATLTTTIDTALSAVVPVAWSVNDGSRVVSASSQVSVVDTSPPDVEAAVLDIDGRTITVRFTEATTGPDLDGFGIYVGGAYRAISTSVRIDAFTATLTLAVAVPPSAVLQLSYSRVLGDVTDLPGNEIPTSSWPITNNSQAEVAGGSVAFLWGPLKLTALDNGTDGTIEPFVAEVVEVQLQLIDGLGRVVSYSASATLEGMLTDAAGAAQTGGSDPAVSSLHPSRGELLATFTAPGTPGFYRLTIGVDGTIFGPYGVQVRRR